MKLNRKALVSGVSVLFGAPRVWAFGAGAGLPWEDPIRKIANSLTGPVAMAVAIIALMIAGGVLVFGGDLPEFARRLCLLVLAISFLVGGSAFMAMLFGVAGALI